MLEIPHSVPSKINTVLSLYIVYHMDILHTSVSAFPGIPQNISATEILRPRDNICIILVVWDPPANSDPSDIGQYIVYVPSRNIGKNISSSTLTTLTIPKCGDDTRIQVAAVNHVGCVGMNSSEVQPVPLDIPTAPATIEGGSASTSSKHLKIIIANINLCLNWLHRKIIMQVLIASMLNMSIILFYYCLCLPDQLSAGAIAGITIVVVLVVIVCICIISGVIIVYIYWHFKKKIQNLTV